MGGFRYIDLGSIAYEEALGLQTDDFQYIIDAKSRKEHVVNTLYFCEHEPVFTIGNHGNDSNLLISETLLKERGISLYRTNRGGDITYHGPGQITGYPVFDLEYFKMGLRQYVETLEEIIIHFLSVYDIQGQRMAGATGVWIEPETERARKIAAIGVKSSRFVTMHGFALNINTDLNYFSLIHPCGFIDKGVTSLAAELRNAIDIDKCKMQLVKIFMKFFSQV